MRHQTTSGIDSARQMQSVSLMFGSVQSRAANPGADYYPMGLCCPIQLVAMSARLLSVTVPTQFDDFAHVRMGQMSRLANHFKH